MSEPTDEADDGSRPTADILATLVASHRDFLAFVQRRVGDRALAEEIVQDAFVRSLDKLDSVRDSAVGWFYRVLRNAIIDHHRRHQVAGRRQEAYAAEQELEPADDAELERIACR